MEERKRKREKKRVNKKEGKQYLHGCAELLADKRRVANDVYGGKRPAQTLRPKGRCRSAFSLL